MKFSFAGAVLDSLGGRGIFEVPEYCTQIGRGRTQCQGRREGVRKVLL